MAKLHQKSLTQNETQILTDQAIAKLFLSLYRYYQDAKPKHPNNQQALYDDLEMSMCWEFEFGALKPYKNNQQAQQEAYKVLNTFWEAHKKDWATSSHNTFRPRYNFPANITTLLSKSDHFLRYHYCHDDLTDLLFFTALISPNHLYHYSGGAAASSLGTSDALAKLAVVFLLIGAAVAVCVATYLIAKYLTESIERFSYHEGFFDALAPIAGMLAGGAIAGFASSLLLTGVLTTLAIAASANPVGFSIGIIVALTLVGAAIGGAIAKYSKEHANAKSHPNSLNPHEPHRFRLTSSEEKHLEEQNLDPIKVKCAIIALMKTIKTTKVPHLFSRNANTQHSLDQVRQLRAGNIAHLDIQGLSFNLMKDKAMQPPAYSEQDEAGAFSNLAYA